MGTVEFTGLEMMFTIAPATCNCKQKTKRMCEAEVYTWAELSDPLAKCLHDASVRVEEVVTGHPGLARHPGWDDDQVAPGQSISQLLLAGEAVNSGTSFNVAQICCDLASPELHLVDMARDGHSHPGSTDNVVQRKGVHECALLHQQ